MIKNISILLILFLTSLSYGQNITLLKNTNPKAKELRHYLNFSKDSLILDCESKIITVDIFNEDYDQKHHINAHNAKLSLEAIPIGNFIIEAKLNEKIIVMDLIKHETSYDSNNSALSQNLESVTEGKGMMLDEELNVITSAPNSSIEFILTRGQSKDKRLKNEKYYWTEVHINNDIGSSKTMRLVNQKSVDKMITKHKLEMHSETGKLNKLTVWEVYDRVQFMENQVSNPKFVYTLTTDLFNPTPYYSTTHSIQNL